MTIHHCFGMILQSLQQQIWAMCQTQILCQALQIWYWNPWNTLSGLLNNFFLWFFFSSQALVFECHVHFQTSWVLVQCDKHSEQPVISKILESLFVCVWMGRELSRCDFAAFPKLKLEPEGCPFETRRNLSRISYSIELPSEKGHLQWFWGMEGGAEIALHIPMGTISKRVGGVDFKWIFF